MAILEHLKKKGPFKSFEEIRAIEMMPDPIKIVVGRIIAEIEDVDDIKYNLFTTPYFKKF
jgi:predicted nucleic acid-binding OB-fold protein